MWHVVLFRPRADLTVEERVGLMAALARALSEIPHIRRFELGRRVRHGAGYEQLMAEDLEYAALLNFDDMDGLKAYLEHPAHRDLGTRFTTSLAASAIYDYEPLDPASLAGRPQDRPPLG